MSTTTTTVIVVHKGQGCQASNDQFKRLKELYNYLLVVEYSRGGRMLQKRGEEWVDITEENYQRGLQEAQEPYDAMCQELNAYCTWNTV